jgi:hypothetical protein
VVGSAAGIDSGVCVGSAGDAGNSNGSGTGNDAGSISMILFGRPMSTVLPSQ